MADRSSSTCERRRRQTRIILLTGWGQQIAAGEDDQPLAVDRLLPKPTRLHDLRAVLTELAEAELLGRRHDRRVTHRFEIHAVRDR